MNVLNRPTSPQGGQPSAFSHIDVRPRMPGFGAWVEGVDLSGPIAPPVVRELRAAWIEYGVLFFHGQPRLTPEQQLALTYVFGSGPSSGNPLIPRLDAGNWVERIYGDETKRAGADVWHADHAWGSLGVMGTLVQIQEKPPVGGNTAWRCTHKAYEWLSAPMQQCLEQLTAVHNFHTRRRTRAASQKEQAGPEIRIPPGEQPVVLTHPLSGRKSLYVNEHFTTHIKDMHEAESDALLRMLFDWLNLPEFQIHHEWEENGVAIWDNYRTHHYAMNDYFPARRVNQRVTLLEPPKNGC